MHTVSQQIVASARTWIGTRFHHQGRLKRTPMHKGGCDCLGLLVGVAQELKLKNKQGELLYLFDETNYSHLPDGIRFRDKLAEHLIEIDPVELRAGDIALFNLDGNPQHVGIIAEYEIEDEQSLIHAFAQAKSVVETRLDECWRVRIVAGFRVYAIPQNETRQITPTIQSDSLLRPIVNLGALSLSASGASSA